MLKSAQTWLKAEQRIIGNKEFASNTPNRIVSARGSKAPKLFGRPVEFTWDRPIGTVFERFEHR